MKLEHQHDLAKVSQTLQPLCCLHAYFVGQGLEVLKTDSEIGHIKHAVVQNSVQISVYSPVVKSPVFPMTPRNDTKLNLNRLAL